MEGICDWQLLLSFHTNLEYVEFCQLRLFLSLESYESCSYYVNSSRCIWLCILHSAVLLSYYSRSKEVIVAPDACADGIEARISLRFQVDVRVTQLATFNQRK
uniref:Ovule protein n=1 Tax=Heterorhabditis bacteriophora TaxID=37862 RepID=A0A1I7WWN5_HETBA